MDLGDKLKDLRVCKKMTQKELSNRLGVSKSVISSYESGTRFPSYDVLIKIAQIFNVSTDYLLGLEKKRVLDISDLTNIEIEAIEKIIEAFRDNKSRK